MFDTIFGYGQQRSHSPHFSRLTKDDLPAGVSYFQRSTPLTTYKYIQCDKQTYGTQRYFDHPRYCSKRLFR